MGELTRAEETVRGILEDVGGDYDPTRLAIVLTATALKFASVSEKVAALQEEGGQVLTLELDEFDGGYGFADENGITVMPDEGRYLVVRIEGEET